MRIKKHLAFGVTPSYWRYHLRYARYKALAETLVDLTVDSGGDGRIFDLLDIGLGTGRTAQYLEAEGIVDHFRLHGVDIKSQRLDSVYRAEQWQLKQADIQAGFPYPDDQFDVVICEQVLEHLDAPGGVIGEISRVLKPGGIAFLGVPIFPAPLAVLRRHLVPPLLRMLNIPLSSHVQVFTLRTFTNLVLESCHLKVREVRGFRIISGVDVLENWRWWWRFNLLLGRTVPSLCVEVQIVAEKPIPPIPDNPT